MGHYRNRELSFFLTNRCNLDCTYCYPGDYKEANRSLDESFARCAIRDYIGKGSINKIRFYAVGEPTLEFNLMKRLHNYAKSRRKGKLVTEVQTNGVFSESKAVWIAKNIDIVWISMDGPPRYHDLYRPLKNGDPTSPIIKRNIGILQQESNCLIGMRVTVGRLLVNHLEDFVEYAAKLGIRYVYMHHMIKQQGKRKSLKKGESLYDLDLIYFAKKYLEILKIAEKKGIFCGNFLTINFDEEVPYYCRACEPCPQLTVDGYISSCDKAPYGKDPRFKDLIYGRYNKEQDIIEYFDKRIKYIRERTVSNMKKCRECDIQKNCGGSCLGESNFLYGDIYEPIDKYCAAVKFLAKKLPRNTGLFPIFHP